MNCLNCRGNKLIKLIETKENKSVGSDCKPLNYDIEVYQCENCQLFQKRVDDTYRKRTNALYENYQAFALTNGKEQLNFSADVPMSRCQTILENCRNLLPQQGKALDIGTGSGVMLSALAKICPNMQLYGQDVSDHQRRNIEKNVALSSFFTGELQKVPVKFELITLIHVLEHVEDLASFLSDIKSLLAPNGKLLIQVPNIEENIWDFAIFDHIWHFTQGTLVSVVSPWFDAITLPKQIGKELTIVVGALGEKSTTLKSISSNAALASCFNQYLHKLNGLKQKQEYCFVLGTGPSAVFTANFLGKYCLGFVDEDANKIGKFLMGLPIKDSREAITNTVILPYPKVQQHAIKQRLAHLSTHCLIEEKQQ